MPMSNFQKKVTPILKTCHVSTFIVYTNTRRVVKCETPKLGAWIDKNGLKSDILMIIGTLQKEQKFYHIQKVIQSNAANAAILDTCSEVAHPCNPQILTATSSAANAGINNPEVFGVCHTEFPNDRFGQSNSVIAYASKTSWNIDETNLIFTFGLVERKRS